MALADFFNTVILLLASSDVTPCQREDEYAKDSGWLYKIVAFRIKARS
jgi:hypothetical protein